MTQTSQAWTESFVEVAKGKVHLLKGGTGEPLLILHRDVGNPGWLPFYEDLAQRITAAFASMNYADPVHKEVFDLEGCTAFVPGTAEGFDTLEAAAKEEGLI